MKKSEVNIDGIIVRTYTERRTVNITYWQKKVLIPIERYPQIKSKQMIYIFKGFRKLQDKTIGFKTMSIPRTISREIDDYELVEKIQAHISDQVVMK